MAKIFPNLMKITRHARKLENTTHTKEKNQQAKVTQNQHIRINKQGHKISYHNCIPYVQNTREREPRKSEKDPNQNSRDKNYYDRDGEYTEWD